MLFIYMMPVCRETREVLQLFLAVSREMLRGSSLTLLHETSWGCQIYALQFCVQWKQTDLKKLRPIQYACTGVLTVELEF